MWERFQASRDLSLTLTKCECVLVLIRFSQFYQHNLSVHSKLKLVCKCLRVKIPGAHSCWLKSQGGNVAFLACELLLPVLLGKHSISLFHFLNEKISYRGPTQNEGDSEYHLLSVAKYTRLRCLVCAIPNVTEMKQPNCTSLGSFTIVSHMLSWSE